MEMLHMFSTCCNYCSLWYDHVWKHTQRHPPGQCMYNTHLFIYLFYLAFCLIYFYGHIIQPHSQRQWVQTVAGFQIFLPAFIFSTILQIPGTGKTKALQTRVSLNSPHPHPSAYLSQCHRVLRHPEEVSPAATTRTWKGTSGSHLLGKSVPDLSVLIKLFQEVAGYSDNAFDCEIKDSEPKSWAPRDAGSGVYHSSAQAIWLRLALACVLCMRVHIGVCVCLVSVPGCLWSPDVSPTTLPNFLETVSHWPGVCHFSTRLAGQQGSWEPLFLLSHLWITGRGGFYVGPGVQTQLL